MLISKQSFAKVDTRKGFAWKFIGPSGFAKVDLQRAIQQGVSDVDLAGGLQKLRYQGRLCNKLICQGGLQTLFCHGSLLAGFGKWRYESWHGKEVCKSWYAKAFADVDLLWGVATVLLGSDVTKADTPREFAKVDMPKGICICLLLKVNDSQGCGDFQSCFL